MKQFISNDDGTVNRNFVNQHRIMKRHVQSQAVFARFDGQTMSERNGKRKERLKEILFNFHTFKRNIQVRNFHQSKQFRHQFPMK